MKMYIFPIEKVGENIQLSPYVSFRGGGVYPCLCPPLGHPQIHTFDHRCHEAGGRVREAQRPALVGQHPLTEDGGWFSKGFFCPPPQKKKNIIYIYI